MNEEVVKRYQRKREALGEASLGDVGEKRKLRMELQQKYGLTELEATNILNGYHVEDYLNKYERIGNLIPTHITVIGKGPEEETGREED